VTLLTVYPDPGGKKKKNLTHVKPKPYINGHAVPTHYTQILIRGPEAKEVVTIILQS
jgi:hypothetical protein